MLLFNVKCSQDYSKKTPTLKKNYISSSNSLLTYNSVNKNIKYDSGIVTKANNYLMSSKANKNKTQNVLKSFNHSNINNNTTSLKTKVGNISNTGSIGSIRKIGSIGSLGSLGSANRTKSKL